MALVWQYGEKSGNESWKGLSWGMVSEQSSCIQTTFLLTFNSSFHCIITHIQTALNFEIHSRFTFLHTALMFNMCSALDLIKSICPNTSGLLFILNFQSQCHPQKVIYSGYPQLGPQELLYGVSHVRITSKEPRSLDWASPSYRSCSMLGDQRELLLSTLLSTVGHLLDVG